VVKIAYDGLLSVFKKAKSEIDKWHRSEGVSTEFQGQGGYKIISGPVCVALMSLVDASADHGKEVSDLQSKRCVMALDEFGPLLASWLRRQAVQAANPSGEQSLWESWERVVEAFEPLKDRFEHSVKYLIEVANAPREQIARMYGWIDADGIPEIDKVQEEYEKPGTHFDKETWVSPSMRARKAIIDGQWEARTQPRSILFDPDALIDYKKPKGAPIAPPSLETLLEHDAPPAQMARLHGISEDEAAALKLEYAENKLKNGEKLAV
jgi:hypothetical protein